MKTMDYKAYLVLLLIYICLYYNNILLDIKLRYKEKVNHESY